MDKRPIDNQLVPIDDMQRYRGLMAEIRELEYRAAERDVQPAVEGDTPELGFSNTHSLAHARV